MPTPKTDTRNSEEILKELEDLASSYVQEWKDRNDSGYALLQIFANMADQIVNHINRVPNKNFIAFLNMLGTNLLPAQPARVPVTFYLAEGTRESVLVPARTQVAAPETDQHPAITFETEKTMTAEVSQLKAAYSVDPTIDQVFNHKTELDDGKTLELFVSPESQEHALYLGHDHLFNLRKGVGEGHLFVKLEAESVDGDLNSKNIIWEYWGETKEGKDKWIEFGKPSSEESPWPASEKTVILKKTNPKPTKKKEIEGKETFWIRARVQDGLPEKKLKLTKLKACIKNEVQPDWAFYNDAPIDLTKSFYPFGTQPNTYDTLYIGSQEGFSKKDTDVSIDFRLINPGGSESSTGNPLLSWEYWNGNGWNMLKPKNAGYRSDAFVENIEFKCPQDIGQTKVNGKEDYWIRVRIISGNYGIRIEESGKSPNPPEIGKITIVNSSESQRLHYCLGNNNLQFSDHSNTDVFEPFQPLEDKRQAIYLGFDKPSSTGRISVFFSLEKQEYSEKTKPRIEWSYSRAGNGKAEWIPLQVLDTTESFTRHGTIEFVGPYDLDKVEKFGQDLHWIRAEIVDARFEPFEKTVSTYVQTKAAEALLEEASPKQIRLKCGLGHPTIFLPVGLNRIRRLIAVEMQALKAKEEQTPSTRPLKDQAEVLQSLPAVSVGPCIPETLFHPKFTTPRDIREQPPTPRIKGIYLNTTWAVQAETISNEALGTSDGTDEQAYSLSRHPVLSESIWIREPSIPETESSKGIEANPVEITGNGEIWVNWQPMEDFFESNEKSRHYAIDRVSGKVHFGDGKYGMIPPVAASIKATYQVGGGAKGNVAKGEVSNILTSIAFIDKVSNPDAAQGGADAEIVDRALEKAPKRIQHRHRAVTKEDYEWLAKESSRAVARVKCIPNFNDEGKQEPGSVSVILVPESNEDRPSPSSELLKMTEEYIKTRNPATVSNLTITFPTYLSLSVTADAYISSIELASSVKFAAMKQLTEFLHPLHGGHDGNGWDFGKMPCLSDIIALLENVPNVDHVENLSVTAKEEKTGISFTISELKQAISLPPYVLISSGAHQIGIRSED